ncbi:hypothetical protein D3C75_1259770 [compost metagenome]
MDEALKTIQDEGQVLLDKAVKEQAEKKQKGDSGNEESTSDANQGGDSAEVITITK